MWWTRSIEGGLQRVNHAAVSSGNCLFSFGGFSIQEDAGIIRPMDVHVLDTETLEWTILPYCKNNHRLDVPFQRYGHSAVAYAGAVYIWGGRNDLLTCNRLFSYDIATNIWTAPKVMGSVPGSRDGHSVCLHKDVMYIYGGYENQQNIYTKNLYGLNLNSLCWSSVQTNGISPSLRDFHTSVVIEDIMYVFGGRRQQNMILNFDDESAACVEYLDLKTKRWHRPEVTGYKPHGRRSHTAFVYKEKMFVFGGYSSTLQKHFNDLNQFDPKTNKWTKCTTFGKPPCGRRRQSGILCNHRLFLFGGTSDQERPSHNLQITYHPDLHILDFKPSLKTLAVLAIKRNQVDISALPTCLQLEVQQWNTKKSIKKMSEDNSE